MHEEKERPSFIDTLKPEALDIPEELRSKVDVLKENVYTHTNVWATNRDKKITRNSAFEPTHRPDIAFIVHSMDDRLLAGLQHNGYMVIGRNIFNFFIESRGTMRGSILTSNETKSVVFIPKDQNISQVLATAYEAVKKIEDEWYKPEADDTCFESIRGSSKLYYLFE